jgi:hypothetical protein
MGDRCRSCGSRRRRLSSAGGGLGDRCLRCCSGRRRLSSAGGSLEVDRCRRRRCCLWRLPVSSASSIDCRTAANSRWSVSILSCNRRSLCWVAPRSELSARKLNMPLVATRRGLPMDDPIPPKEQWRMVMMRWPLYSNSRVDRKFSGTFKFAGTHSEEPRPAGDGRTDRAPPQTAPPARAADGGHAPGSDGSHTAVRA